MKDFNDHKPNGCDIYYWKKCEEKGYLIKRTFCHHPDDCYDHNDTPIYPYKKRDNKKS